MHQSSMLAADSERMEMLTWQVWWISF